MTTETAPTPVDERIAALEARLAGLEEILGELGHFSFISVGGKTVKVTGAAASTLSKLGEGAQTRVRQRLATDPRVWFSSHMIRALAVSGADSTQKENT